MGLLRRARQRALRAIPLQAFERAIPREVIGFHYHLLADAPPPHVRHLFRPKTPEQFECDLLFLRENFRLLSYEDLLRLREGGAGGGRPAAVLTFDDGYAECFSVVRPLLLEHGVPCTFFVTTEFLDNRRLFFRNKASLCIERVRAAGAGGEALRELSEVAGRELRDEEALIGWLRDREVGEERMDRACDVLGVDVAEFLRTRRPYMTSEEVRTLAGEGLSVGAHTRTHPRLERLSDPEIEDEVAGSCRTIAGLVGAGSVPFAFPFSGRGIRRSLLAGIRDRNPEVGLIFDTRRLRRDRDFVIQRIPAERPPEGGGVRSTLPDDLRSAYLNQVGRGLAGLLRGGSEAA